MDAASSQPGELALEAGPALADAAEYDRELWSAAQAGDCGLTPDEFAKALARTGARLNYNQPPGMHADPAQKMAFYRGLKLPEFAIAQACALGREPAWEGFLKLYRGPLTQAAISISGSATLGHELADSLYGELFGLTERDGERRSPLAGYSGRGSLLGWLRTTLAQRHVDHHRRTFRESPLDTLDAPAAAPDEAAPELAGLAVAIRRTLHALPAEDRFLLSSYFLDEKTLHQIGRVLKVHEATISRRLKRLTADLRKQLLHHLERGGLSRRAAEEALGADPRVIEVNLRRLLQTSQTEPFQGRR